MNKFDIVPYSLPNGVPEEVRFEDPHDVHEVEILFGGKAPASVELHYLQKTWPACRSEWVCQTALDKPAAYGMLSIDDPVNSQWRKARTTVRARRGKRLSVGFKGLCSDRLEPATPASYDVDFRRTIGVRVVSTEPIQQLHVYTRSKGTSDRLRVELDAGRRTKGKTLTLSGHHAVIDAVTSVHGLTCSGDTVKLGARKKRVFSVAVTHMEPAPHSDYDEGLITFSLDREVFTISLKALLTQGPVWYEQKGVFVSREEDLATYEGYARDWAGELTVTETVVEREEHSLVAAMRGQPRPHPVPFVFGCRYAREKFWMEPNGNLVMPGWPLLLTPGKHKADFLSKRDCSVLLGLDGWLLRGRYCDPFPVLAYNLNFYRNGIELHQRVFATPLAGRAEKTSHQPDDKQVAMMKLSFRNAGSSRSEARLQLSYSSAANKEIRVPGVPDPLSVSRRFIKAKWGEGAVVRAQFDTTMRATQTDATTITYSKWLKPGETCELVLRVPYSVMKTASEKRALAALDFDTSYRAEKRLSDAVPKGAHLHTPHEQLNLAHRGHPAIVDMADFAFLDGSGLVNTSVGAATYLNYTNESCMILQDLDQRGLHDEVRKRINVWIKYQGTMPLIGDFSDQEGVYYGAGGLEFGASYNQHHGWVLWYIAEHFFVTRDTKWLKEVAASLVDGAEWVVRQRARTKKKASYSRGWERGFLPAGALEDIDDYFFWLATNCLTWRGLHSAAKALAAISHPDAERLAKEADRFATDLRRGHKFSREYSPLVRLRDGRWIPHTPSRLYRRGRDVGWIREVLEGSLYLVLSGLYSATSKEATWILDDFQDTRYMNPPFGQPVVAQALVPPEVFEKVKDPVADWYCQGGFSFQPNLLAGLTPYLDRDEIEVFLWMFFNGWAACYREEIGGMVEHAMPVLGFANQAPFKTSDQANVLKWLRQFFVYELDGGLHLGRAIPRRWFAQDEPFWLDTASTTVGRVGVRFIPNPAEQTAEALIEYTPHDDARAKTLRLRFRLPTGARMKSVAVNGKRYSKYSAETGDIDLSGKSGKISIRVSYT